MKTQSFVFDPRSLKIAAEGRCPNCGLRVMFEETHVKCSDRFVCKLKIANETWSHILNDENYKESLSSGIK